MPNLSIARTSRRRRPAAGAAPSTLTATTTLVADKRATPPQAYVEWRAAVSSPPAEGFVSLDESGELTMSVYLGAKGDNLRALDEGTECSAEELRAASKVLATLADRVEREHRVARRQLAEWRRQYDRAFQPIELPRVL